MNKDLASLAQERHLSTTEERKILALEMIADQLQSVAESLARIGEIDPDKTAAISAAATDSDRRAGDRWENEGGNFQPEPGEAPEIERSLVPHYAVGGYSYTNLVHAIAEAKRARRLGQNP